MAVGDSYHKVLAMCKALYSEKEYPKGHTELANALWWSGRWDVIWKAGRDWAIAESGKQDCLKSIEMLEKIFPENEYPHGHPLVAERLSEMGTVLAEVSEYDKAVEFSSRGLDMCERFYSRDQYPNGHPTLARALYNLGMIRASKGFSLFVIDKQKDLSETELNRAGTRFCARIR